MAKSNLPKTLGSEYTKLSELAVKYNRTTTGNTSYTSPSSGTTYNTAGSAYANQGEEGLYALLQIALQNYIILAGDFNNKIDTGALSDTDIAVDDSGFDTISGSEQGAINSSIDTKFTNDDKDYVRNPGYALTSGSPTAYTITLSPAPASYTTGMRIAIKLHVNCGASPTLNVNGLGAKTLKKHVSVDLMASDYRQDQIIMVMYDGTNFQILTNVDASPVGEVKWMATSVVPSGYLECNGSAISRTTYAALFASIGTTFGAGNGSTTFNIPDLRGEFIRGWDNGRSVDTGRAFGSSQTDEFEQHTHTGTTSSGGSHSHTIAVYGGAGSTNLIKNETNLGGGTFSTSTAPDHTHTFTTASSGDATETRPRNVALLPVIKYI